MQTTRLGSTALGATGLEITRGDLRHQHRERRADLGCRLERIPYAERTAEEQRLFERGLL